MEKKGNTCPISMCEKMYKKVTVSPAFQSIRRISHRLQPPRYACTSSPINTLAIQSKPAHSSSSSLKSQEAAGIMVPINFEYSTLPQPELIQKNTQIAHRNEPTKMIPAQRLKADSKQKSFQVNMEGGEKSGVHIEDRFTDYINRAKSKIRRSISNHPESAAASSGNNGKLSDNAAAPGKDKFTDYIERTKKKLRTTSSMGVGKRNSFK